MKQYEDARIAASLEQGNSGEEFRILDPAIPPRMPTAPNRLWLILIGCAAALVCAFAAIVIAEKLDNTFHSPDELREAVDAPILATIPHVTVEHAVRVRRTLVAGRGAGGSGAHCRRVVVRRGRQRSDHAIDHTGRHMSVLGSLTLRAPGRPLFECASRMKSSASRRRCHPDASSSAGCDAPSSGCSGSRVPR